ncbi:hypothetical protein BTA51_03975 [Hahella sp. CCB-MM4]|uniref:phytanoyl-CoA dioxygenase family protein n=1 Tax=Hahella sp. (strain CCB-MM4) TaxID=1926491 RepID=UPI000B9BA469|nr:phytanoyl-CoA dioxygenase family protein [Hahella sp. CCB-MM4]OZG74184.1 hypothetical protein BTA51_03975 [Hahella sp. CCB-MM4]
MTFYKNGYELLENAVSSEIIETIKQELALSAVAPIRGGIRNAEKRFASIRALINSPILPTLAKAYLTEKASVVRVILFDKTPENNWLVSWHQDKTVAVSQRFELKEWGPWSIKDNTHHVQPPASVLNQMVTFRIHLDATDESNGCLKVIPGSHQYGILTQEMTNDISKQHNPISCEADEGSILVMRPHLLHASSKAINPGHRRVLHVEYSDYRLPEGVSWA